VKFFKKPMFFLASTVFCAICVILSCRCSRISSTKPVSPGTPLQVFYSNCPTEIALHLLSNIIPPLENTDCASSKGRARLLSVLQCITDLDRHSATYKGLVNSVIKIFGSAVDPIEAFFDFHFLIDNVLERHSLNLDSIKPESRCEEKCQYCGICKVTFEDVYLFVPDHLRSIQPMFHPVSSFKVCSSDVCSNRKNIPDLGAKTVKCCTCFWGTHLRLFIEVHENRRFPLHIDPILKIEDSTKSLATLSLVAVLYENARPIGKGARFFVAFYGDGRKTATEKIPQSEILTGIGDQFRPRFIIYTKVIPSCAYSIKDLLEYKLVQRVPKVTGGSRVLPFMVLFHFLLPKITNMESRFSKILSNMQSDLGVKRGDMSAFVSELNEKKFQTFNAKDSFTWLYLELSDVDQQNAGMHLTARDIATCTICSSTIVSIPEKPPIMVRGIPYTSPPKDPKANDAACNSLVVKFSSCASETKRYKCILCNLEDERRRVFTDHIVSRQITGLPDRFLIINFGPETKKQMATKGIPVYVPTGRMMVHGRSYSQLEAILFFVEDRDPALYLRHGKDVWVYLYKDEIKLQSPIKMLSGEENVESTLILFYGRENEEEQVKL
jgi:hypothetical protein